MGKLFAPNISGWGRLVRAIWGLACLGGALALFPRSQLACFILVLAGAVALFEAIRGWCVVRACGIKTKV